MRKRKEGRKEGRKERRKEGRKEGRTEDDIEGYSLLAPVVIMAIDSTAPSPYRSR
jgi:hypothetical protein